MNDQGQADYFPCVAQAWNSFDDSFGIHTCYSRIHRFARKFLQKRRISYFQKRMDRQAKVILSIDMTSNWLVFASPLNTCALASLSPVMCSEVFASVIRGF